MSIALAIAFIFQSLFRVPARKKLRRALADVTNSLAQYNILFQTSMNHAAPVEDVDEATLESKRAALETIGAALVAREVTLQNDILALYPLLKFATLEPAFGSPFQLAAMSKLIAKHQLLLGEGFVSF